MALGALARRWRAALLEFGGHRGAAFRGWARRRHEWLWVPPFFAFVTLVLYAPVWLPFAGVDGEAQWFGWDTIETYWPDLAYLGESFARGDVPLWNPYDRGGYAFAADPQPGLFYPVSWLFALVVVVVGDAPAWIMQAKALFHHALLGALMYAYLRSRALGRAVCVFGGVAAMCAMPIVIHKASNLMWPLAWVPLIWIAADRLVERSEGPGWWRRAAFLGVAVAVSGSAGSPPGFFYALLATAPLGAHRIATALEEASGRRTLGRTALLVGRGVTVAALVAAAMLIIVYLPARELADASPRQNATAEWALEGALEAAPMIHGMISPPAGVLNGYMGLAVLVLGVAAAFGRGRADGGAPIVLVATAMFGLLLAVGDEIPVLPFLIDHAPGFDRFRIPSRYTMVAALPLAAAAAHGLSGLLDDDRRARRLAAATTGAVWLLAAVDLAVLATTIHTDPYGDHTLTYGDSATVLFGLGALIVMATVAPARWRVVPACALAALVFHDATTFGKERVFLGEPPPDHAADRAHLADLGDVRRQWRVWDEFLLEQRPGSRLRVRELRGYPAGDPLEDARYQELRLFAGEAPEILEAFNVRWILWWWHHRLAYVQHHVWSPPTTLAPDHFVYRGGERYEARHPAPLVAWYGGAEWAETSREALLLLLDAEDADGTRRTTVVEPADIPAALQARVEGIVAAAIEPRRPRPSVAGELVSYAPERIAFTVDAPAEGIVVLNEAWAPGWRVTVDGAEATPFRASFLLRGVVVDAGKHVIVWRYQPEGWRWQSLLWWGAWLLVGAAAVSAIRDASRRRARPSGGS